MIEKVPAVLVVLTCTVLNHALKEWEKNGGAPPAQRTDTSDSGGKRRPGDYEYFFNRVNDGG
jgi:hypothetical protein